MNSKLIVWLQVVSNVGILIGLLLVGLQMKQATEIAAAQLQSDGLVATMGAYEMLAGEGLPVAWSKAMQNAPDLTDAELAAIQAFLSREAISLYRLESLGGIGFNPTPGTINKWVFVYLGNDYTLRWFRSAGNPIRNSNQRLYDTIDARLTAQGADHRTSHARYLSELRGRDPVVTAPIDPAAN